MMGLYRRITGREPATSVGAPERPNEGIAAGPLIRFLEAAGKPLKIDFLRILAEPGADDPEGRFRAKPQRFGHCDVFRRPGYSGRYAPTRFNIH